MEPRHQPLKAGVPVVAFAAAFGVQDRVPQIEPRNVLDDPGVTLRPIDAGHGVKAHALAASVDLQPDAIVLYFVYPAVSDRRAAGARRKAGIDEISWC